MLSRRSTVVIAALAATMTSADASSQRTEIAGGYYAGCMREDGARLSRRGFKDAEIRKYCSCVSKVFASHTPLPSEMKDAEAWMAKFENATRLANDRCASIIARPR